VDKIDPKLDRDDEVSLPIHGMAKAFAAGGMNVVAQCGRAVNY
jgi:hypothetical protein